jgi:hypothetical protein
MAEHRILEMFSELSIFNSGASICSWPYVLHSVGHSRNIPLCLTCNPSYLRDLLEGRATLRGLDTANATVSAMRRSSSGVTASSFETLPKESILVTKPSHSDRILVLEWFSMY